jgi:hypothetical protein
MGVVLVAGATDGFDDGAAVEVEDGLCAGAEDGVSGKLNVWFKVVVVASVGLSRRIAGVV